MTVLRHQVAPHDHVPVFYSGEAGIDVLLLRIRFSFAEDSIEKGGVGLVLPVMFEGVNIRLVARGAFGFGGGCHVWKYARTAKLSALKRGQPFADKEMS
jgi:hypothetical protein